MFKKFTKAATDISLGTRRREDHRQKSNSFHFKLFKLEQTLLTKLENI